jgi:hypothetical protein
MRLFRGEKDWMMGELMGAICGLNRWWIAIDDRISFDG